MQTRHPNIKKPIDLAAEEFNRPSALLGNRNVRRAAGENGNASRKSAGLSGQYKKPTCAIVPNLQSRRSDRIRLFLRNARRKNALALLSERPEYSGKLFGRLPCAEHRLAETRPLFARKIQPCKWNLFHSVSHMRNLTAAWASFQS